MENSEFSRRSFLRAVTGALGVSWFALDWSSIAEAAHDAHLAGKSPGAAAAFLTHREAADVEAICAQIIPSDATPGAREAGVVFFIDRALATFFPRLRMIFASSSMSSRLKPWRATPAASRLPRCLANGKSSS